MESLVLDVYQDLNEITENNNKQEVHQELKKNQIEVDYLKKDFIQKKMDISEMSENEVLFSDDNDDEDDIPNSNQKKRLQAAVKQALSSSNSAENETNMSKVTEQLLNELQKDPSLSSEFNEETKDITESKTTTITSNDSLKSKKSNMSEEEDDRDDDDDQGFDVFEFNSQEELKSSLKTSTALNSPAQGSSCHRRSSWVQCDQEKCQKWRRVDYVDDITSISANDNWTCNMNADSRRNKCNDTQETIPPEDDEDDDDESTCTTFKPGAIVLGKMPGYPWWPGIVEDDPDFDSYFYVDKKKKDKVVISYHVTFFGKDVSRAWLTEVSITNFDGHETLQDLGTLTYSGMNFGRTVSNALKDAKKAIEMTKEDRIDTYGFLQRYKSKNKAKKTSVTKRLSNNNIVEKCENNIKEVEKIKQNGILNPTIPSENKPVHQRKTTARIIKEEKKRLKLERKRLKKERKERKEKKRLEMENQQKIECTKPPTVNENVMDDEKSSTSPSCNTIQQSNVTVDDKQDVKNTGDEGLVYSQITNSQQLADEMIQKYTDPDVLQQLLVDVDPVKEKRRIEMKQEKERKSKLRLEKKEAKEIAKKEKEKEKVKKNKEVLKQKKNTNKITSATDVPTFKKTKKIETSSVVKKPSFNKLKKKKNPVTQNRENVEKCITSSDSEDINNNLTEANKTLKKKTETNIKNEDNIPFSEVKDNVNEEFQNIERNINDKSANCQEKVKANSQEEKLKENSTEERFNRQKQNLSEVKMEKTSSEERLKENSSVVKMEESSSKEQRKENSSKEKILKSPEVTKPDLSDEKIPSKPTVKVCKERHENKVEMKNKLPKLVKPTLPDVSVKEIIKQEKDNSKKIPKLKKPSFQAPVKERQTKKTFKAPQKQKECEVTIETKKKRTFENVDVDMNEYEPALKKPSFDVIENDVPELLDINTMLSPVAITTTDQDNMNDSPEF